MKILYLIRHAKSSWDNPELNDHDRPLNSRGARALGVMAIRLEQSQWRAQQVYSSTALRALDTAAALAVALSDQQQPQALERLYSFDWEELAALIQSEPGSCDSMALVGHNPAMHALLDWLTGGSGITKFPTCAVAKIGLNISSWNELTAGCGELLGFDYPKKCCD